MPARATARRPTLHSGFAEYCPGEIRDPAAADGTRQGSSLKYRPGKVRKYNPRLGSGAGNQPLGATFAELPRPASSLRCSCRRRPS